MKIVLNERQRRGCLKEIEKNTKTISTLKEKINTMKEYTEIDFTTSIQEAKDRIKELKENIRINKKALDDGYLIFNGN